MRWFSIHPTKTRPENGVYPRVDSYIKKALKRGKELYGNDFILSEHQTDSWGDTFDTWRRYDCNGVLIADKYGKK